MQPVKVPVNIQTGLFLVGRECNDEARLTAVFQDNPDKPVLEFYILNFIWAKDNGGGGGGNSPGYFGESCQAFHQSSDASTPLATSVNCGCMMHPVAEH